MRRLILCICSLALIAAGPARAGTFARTAIAPDLGLDAFTKTVAHEQVGRDVFSDPYSTITIGSVDVYNVFPYLEARTFQIVSDPGWNRLVFGESGRSLAAYTGAGTALGALSNPRGLSVDEQNRVFVADAGNNRVLVLQASTQYGDIQLTPLFEIRGLSGPYDVAYSDGGTPFSHADDRLYVSDTGRNRVIAYALGDAGAQQVAAIGDLGSGAGHFAGPMAITAGRSGGANTRDVYVADAHSGRIVHLRDDGGGFSWLGDAKDGADVVTSLDTDQWGNLYAAAPNRGVIRKFSPGLTPVADLTDGLSRPRSFHVPFVNVNDHRVGSLTRVGKPNGVSVDQWADASGVRLWNLGVDVSNLAVAAGSDPSASFMLTDQADVVVELVDGATGQTLTRHAAGSMGAGVQTLALDPSDLHVASSGDLLLRVTATSSYPGGPSATAQTKLGPGGGLTATPAQAMLLGNTPNPVGASTRISFMLPANAKGVTLRVFDASGRVVRSFGGGFSPGLNEVVWDARNDHGTAVSAGMYFYRLDVNRQQFTRKLVVVR